MVTLVKECTCVNMEEEEEQKRIIPQQNRTRFAESTLIDKRRSSLPDERSPSYPKPKPVYKRSATWSSRAFQRRASYLESRRFSAAIHTPSLKGVAERGNWGSKWEFLLSCVGLSVGIGNVWRFPYLAYENGGEKCVLLVTFLEAMILEKTCAFLIPYLIMLVLAGKPMYFLELAFGQFAGLGPLAIWSCAPIAKGVGYAMVTVSLVVCIYYNVIMSYTIFYISASFQSIVPWSISSLGIHCLLPTASPRYVLEITPGIESSGGIKWDLALCLLFSWIVVVLCLMKGIKTSGKVVYFAATFPYVILIMLLINGLLLDGAFAGLLDIKVWQAAAGQMFFSLSVSMGGLIMYSSYNDFKNNIYRDAMVVSILDTVTSLISGTVIFSVLGAMSHELNIPIDKVVASGPGLAFVTYPEALSRLPVPQLWSVLFFLMLFILGLDSEFALLENVLTSISDDYPVLRRYKLYMCICTAVLCYFLGLPCVTRTCSGGLSIFLILNNNNKRFCNLIRKYNYEDDIIVNFFTLGLKRFCNDIYFMLGIKPGMYWKVAWLFFAPIILSLIFIYSMVSHEPLKYGDYDYPGWADGLGWILALVSMLQVPIWAIIMVLRQDAPTLRQKLFMAMQPTDEWGPSDSSLKEDWLAMQSRSDSVMLDEIKSEKPETKETASSQNGSVENPAYEGK
ncbi:Sodium- and chloride-dependent glycine transporter 2 [Nymphon striatum]|nr:Sodium- and chloride-dependent glycine transporter 2 [Nymphon striatum]